MMAHVMERYFNTKNVDDDRLGSCNADHHQQSESTEKPKDYEARQPHGPEQWLSDICGAGHGQIGLPIKWNMNFQACMMLPMEQA